MVLYHYWRIILHTWIINNFTHLTFTRHLRSPVLWTHTSLAMTCILGMQNSRLWSLNLLSLYPPTFCCNSYSLVSYVGYCESKNNQLFEFNLFKIILSTFPDSGGKMIIFSLRLKNMNSKNTLCPAWFVTTQGFLKCQQMPFNLEGFHRILNIVAI